MNYATIKTNDIANGPGVRVSLFVSGCEHQCPGCFNQEAWDFEYGKPFNHEPWDVICNELEKPHIKGLTILGGEPLHPRNVGTVTALVIALKELYPDKSIWVYSGYTFESLMARANRIDILNLMQCIDVLVDGPFIESKKNLMLRFRGSENQRLINIPETMQNPNHEIVLWDN